AALGIRYVSSSADITITLTEKAESVLGTTTAYYRFGKVISANVVIATKSAMGLALDRADIQNIAAHEFGHALGLGHSTVYGDVMYESYDFISTSRIMHPSACDVDRILSIYLKDGSGFRSPNMYAESGTFTCQGS
ncbi:MAG TPA: matrixin family metalloprotease, partial [Nitrososphaerales archaeon]